MKKQSAIIFIAFVLLNFAEAQETGVVKEIYLKSPSVDINILGDTTSKKVLIYLPPSYKDSIKEYPVYYFLTGYGTEVDIMFDKGLMLNKFLDNKTKSGEINEMIFVVATSKIRLNYDRMVKSPYTWGAFYENSPITGNWEDFITKELIPYVDSNYRTIKNKNARAISGHSMGGLGAISIGLKNPDLFNCVYSIGAAIIGRGNLETSWMFNGDREKHLAIGLIKKLSNSEHGIADYKAILSEFIENDSLFNGNVILSFAYGSAYFGDSGLNPPYFNYPYHMIDGKIYRNESLWAIWENKLSNHLPLIEAYLYKKNRIENIVIEFGTGDNNKLTQGNQSFSTLLYENDISHEFRYYMGKHGELNARLRQSMIPYLSRHLEFNSNQ